MRGRSSVARKHDLADERVEGSCRRYRKAPCRIKKFGSFPPTRRFRRWRRPSRSCRFGLTVALRPNTFRYAAVRPQPAFDAQTLLAGYRGSVGEILLPLFAPNSGK